MLLVFWTLLADSFCASASFLRHRSRSAFCLDWTDPRRLPVILLTAELNVLCIPSIRLLREPGSLPNKLLSLFASESITLPFPAGDRVSNVRNCLLLPSCPVNYGLLAVLSTFRLTLMSEFIRAIGGRSFFDESYLFSVMYLLWS